MNNGGGVAILSVLAEDLPSALAEYKAAVASGRREWLVLKLKSSSRFEPMLLQLILAGSA
jgi:hypothetical protein